MWTIQNKIGAQALENLTTNGTGNTETDHAFIKPGATRPVVLVACRMQGKASASTTLTGLILRLKQWTGSASTTVGATSITPVAKNNKVPAAASTAGLGSTASSGVTIGTTAAYVGMVSAGGSGPGGWVSINPDDVPSLDGGAAMSQDFVSSSPQVSMNFEMEADIGEGI